MALDNMRSVDVRIDKANDYLVTKLLSKQGDYNGRELIVQITNGGVVENQATTQMNLGWRHLKYGNSGLDPFQLIDAEKGLFGITYSEEMLRTGDVLCTVQIIQGGKLTETRNFNLEVEESPINKKLMVTQDSFKALEKALTQVNEWDGKFESKYTGLEEEYALELTTLKQETTAQFQQTLSISAPSVSSIWEPPIQPTARPDEEGYYESAFTITSDKLINSHYEPLRVANPEYIKRTNKGKDQSGTYDWWRYEFTPKDYEKTIILLSGTHGGETSSALALNLFLKEVVTNWQSHPSLNYIRHKVRLVVIPAVNPWGMSQTKKVRENVNGVDLNRNYGYKHEQSIVVNKGGSAFSEKETKFVQDTLNSYPESVAFIDFHNMISPSANYVLYTPKYLDAPKKLYSRLISSFRKTGETIKWGEMDGPTGFNYAASAFNMNASNPEFGDGIWGRMYDSVEMTQHVKWVGNIVLGHAVLESNNNSESITEPFTVRSYYNHGVGTEIYFGETANVTEYKELEDLRTCFDIPSEGILHVSGEISIQHTASVTDETIAWVLPRVGQTLNKGTATDFSPEKLKDKMWEVYQQGKFRQTIPFSADIPVYPTSKDIGQAEIGLFVKCNPVGVFRLVRYRISATFIPSQKGERLIIFNATGKGGQGPGSMVKEFPSSGVGFDI